MKAKYDFLNRQEKALRIEMTKQIKGKLGICLHMAVMLLSSLLMIGTSVKASEATNQRVVRVAYFESDFFLEGASDAAVKSGYAYEVLHEISNITGWKYEYVYGEWEDLYNKFVAGEIDLFPGLVYCDDWADCMIWPEYAMDVENYSLYMNKKDTSFSRDDWSTINGKRIGLVRDTNISREFLTWMNEYDLHPICVYYDDGNGLVNELEVGNIDGFVGAESNVDKMQFVEAFARIAEAKSYIAVKKDAVDILAELNGALETIETLNPHFYNDLKHKYYCIKITNANLTEAEQAWMEEHQELKIGYVDNFLPYSGTDVNGSPKGIITDIMKQICSILMISEKLPIQYCGYETYNDMLKGLEMGEIDAAFPVMKSVWHAEQSNMIETQALVFSSLSAVYSDNFDSTKLDTIAVNENAVMQKVFVMENYPNSEIIELNSPEECLEAVKSGKAGCTLYNGTRIDKALTGKYDSLEDMSLGKTIGFSIAVRKGDSVILSFLNRGISLMDTSEFANTMYKYVASNHIYSFKSLLQDYAWGLLFVVFLLLILAVSVICLWRKATKAQNRQLQISEQLSDALSKVNEINIHLEKQYQLFKTISKDTLDVFMLNTEKMKSKPVKLNGVMLSEEEKISRPYGPTWKQYIQKYVHADDQERILKEVEFDNVIQELEKADEFSSSYRLAEGKRISNIQVKFSYLDGKKSKYIVFGFRCIDEIIRAEKEQQEILREAREMADAANKAKSTFLFNMSHDIRTPMNAIVGYTELILRQHDDKEKCLDYVSKIQSSSKFLLSLINNVLEMARIESNQMLLDEAPMRTGQIVEEISDVYAELMKKKNIKFTQSLSVQTRYIYADKVKLKEIILNLISNAYKYTPEGGSITLIRRELPCDREGYVLIETVVSDTGIGMSKEFLPKLFDEFTRERGWTESNIQGTGLGMPIVKKLVELMEGTITVESELGKGTTFTIKNYHRKADVEDMQSNIIAVTDTKQFKGKRILLAEDNELNAEIATELLQDVGFVVERAADGIICVDMLQKAECNYFDLILMDIQMPNMDGYKAARTIRKMDDPDKKNIPIIAMTANAFEEDRRDALIAGMDGHMAKPINVNKLIELLADILNK